MSQAHTDQYRKVKFSVTAMNRMCVGQDSGFRETENWAEILDSAI